MKGACSTWLVLGCLGALAVGPAGCGGLTRWLEGKPESRRQYESAEELFEDEDYVQAAVAYRAWLADYHDSEDVLRPFVLYRLGDCYRLVRDYERAVAAYTTIIRMYSDSPDPAVQEVVDLARLQLDDITPKAEPGGPPAGSADE